LKKLEKEVYPPHSVIFWMDEPGINFILLKKEKFASAMQIRMERK
jgi:hypothetical protein